MSEWQPNKPTIEQIQTQRHWQRRMKGDEKGIVIDFELSIGDDYVVFNDKNNGHRTRVEDWESDDSSFFTRDVYRPKPVENIQSVEKHIGQSVISRLRGDIDTLSQAIWPEELGIFDVTVVDSVIDTTRKYAQFRRGPYEISVMGDPDESVDKVMTRIWDLLKERATRRINELQHAVSLR